jgi:tripartite-type tricarboxylate transporter receptor subunit TctC
MIGRMRDLMTLFCNASHAASPARGEGKFGSRSESLLTQATTRRGVLALIGALLPAAALAAYPDRPIRLVVALAPGGPADTAARVFAPYLSEQLGQSVVIENRTGASSVVGTETVVRSAPDGYTLLFGSSSSFAVNPAVMKNLRFDVSKDLKLVGLVSYTPHVLVVRASLAADTLAALVALAKAQPGKLSYASSGPGGAIHLASELFKREAGVDIVHIPYRGGGPAVLGLLTGDVDIFINDASTTVENIRSGKLRALAMAWPKRSALLPDVPTFAELGFPTVVSSSWFGLAAPADTPADIIARLAEAMPQVFASSGYQARLATLGLEQFHLDAGQSADFIKAELDKWAGVAKSARIQVD